MSAPLAACGSDPGGSDSGEGGEGNTATGGNGSSSGGNGNTGSGGEGNGNGSGGSGADARLPGTEHYDCTPPTGSLPQLQLVPYVTSGLDNPVYVTHAPNETDRLFVLEQAGRIKVVKDGAVNATPFLDLTDRVNLSTWEQGLLGLAFHPDYAENGLFYVHYNSLGVSGHPDGSAIIAEFRVSDDPDVADESSERIVLGAPTSSAGAGNNPGYHNGGSIVFGPEKLMFVALGDGGDRSNGQNTSNLRAALSRVDPLSSGAEPYSVPAGNLSEVVQGAAPELWSYGLRNPYRVNFDGCTGDLYIGDVGDRSWEEVNVEPAGQGHHNYGWAVWEGDVCYTGGTGPAPGPGGDCEEPERYRGPFHVYPNNTSGAQFQSVIGGSVYRGSAIPALRGTYFFTDLYGNTRIFKYDAASDSIGAVTSLEDQLNPSETDQGLVAIQNGGDGELYFVARGGSGMDLEPLGAIYRLEAVE